MKSTIIDEVHESAASFSEENEKLLRKHAEHLITNINQVLADRRKVEADNAKDVEILAGMAAEIKKLDAQADGSNLDTLINITARKEQLKKLTAKYGQDAQERLTTSDATIEALNLTGELTALLQEARLVAVEQLTLTLRPFFSNDALVGQFLLRTETMNQISRFQTYTLNHVSTVVEIEAVLRDLLEPTAAGNPPWMFTRTDCPK
jgi:arsenate reductase-like glutaredoxin family protein